MGKSVILTSEGTRQFTRALELLQSSIREFNRIADTMIPEGLINNGLTKYLTEFIEFFESESKIKVQYTSNSEDIPLREEIEIALFRGLRALLVLLFNFARPDLIRIQLNLYEKEVKLQISDGGMNIFKSPTSVISQELDEITKMLKSYKASLTADTGTHNNELEIVVPV